MLGVSVTFETNSDSDKDDSVLRRGKKIVHLRSILNYNFRIDILFQIIR